MAAPFCGYRMVDWCLEDVMCDWSCDGSACLTVCHCKNELLVISVMVCWWWWCPSVGGYFAVDFRFCLLPTETCTDYWVINNTIPPVNTVTVIKRKVLGYSLALTWYVQAHSVIRQLFLALLELIEKWRCIWSSTVKHGACCVHKLFSSTVYLSLPVYRRVSLFVIVSAVVVSDWWFVGWCDDRRRNLLHRQRKVKQRILWSQCRHHLRRRRQQWHLSRPTRQLSHHIQCRRPRRRRRHHPRRHHKAAWQPVSRPYSRSRHLHLLPKSLPWWAYHNLRKYDAVINTACPPVMETKGI